MRKIIIAGGRDFNDWTYFILNCNDLICEDDIILNGGADGADKLAAKYAHGKGMVIHFYQADWKEHGKSAGPIRNEEMACEADALILFWDGESKGSKDMLNRAIKHSLEIHIFFYKQHI